MTAAATAGIVLAMSTGLAVAAPGGNSNGAGYGSCLGKDMSTEATTHFPGYMGDVISSDTQDKVNYTGGSWGPAGPRSVSIHLFLDNRCDTKGSGGK